MVLVNGLEASVELPSGMLAAQLAASALNPGMRPAPTRTTVAKSDPRVEHAATDEVEPQRSPRRYPVAW